MSAPAVQWMSLNPDIMPLPARFDASTAESVEAAARLALRQGTRHLVLDGKDMSYLTGAGLRVLMVLAHDFDAFGGTLAIANLSAQPQQMMAVSELDSLVPVVEVAGAALPLAA